MCNPWQRSSLSVFSLCRTTAAAALLLPTSPSWELERLKDWFIPRDEAVRVVLRSHTHAGREGESSHSAPLGVRHTSERHAGIIRDPSLLKKLRNSHELHTAAGG